MTATTEAPRRLLELEYMGEEPRDRPTFMYIENERYLVRNVNVDWEYDNDYDLDYFSATRIFARRPHGSISFEIIHAPVPVPVVPAWKRKRPKPSPLTLGLRRPS